jgi:putative ABC transport system ATP-binding protein
MIKVKKISKVYGKKDNAYKALDEISFDLESGKSIAIIGKSGSGKSTLMHVLSGLDRVDEGQIEINSIQITEMKPSQRDAFRNKKIGFIFQTFFLHESSTVFENVMLPLEIAGIPFSKRKEQVITALKHVGLEDKFKNKARNLSGGQKQRVCIARALVNDPEIIFADEPTGNLDSENGDKVIKMLLNACKQNGKTLFIVTHDSEIAAQCDQRIHVADGKIISID